MTRPVCAVPGGTARRPSSFKALTSETVSFEGKFYRCKNVRMAARPLQQPYPPLWFAPIEPGRAADAARLKGNMVTLIPNAGVKALTDAYRAAWQAQGNKATDLPALGVYRHVVVADTDAKARDIARGAYRQWRDHMAFLWEWGGLPSPIAAVYPEEFEALEAMSMGVAGTPETVRRYVADSLTKTGITYFVCDFAFGSLPYAAAAPGLQPISPAKDVMPAFRFSRNSSPPAASIRRGIPRQRRGRKASSDLAYFGVLKRCFSFGRGSNVATVPEPRHLISAL